MQTRTGDPTPIRRVPRTGPRRGWRRAAVAIVAASFGLTACFAPGPPPVGSGTIMGPSELTAAQITAYVCHVGRCATWLPEISPQQMAQLYIDEGNLVGVRGDIAFAQSVLETGWFAFLGSPPQSTVPLPAPGDTTFPVYGVLPRDHNYAGLGAFPGSTVFMRMPTPTDGVRAQLQHLRNYADAGSRSTNLGAPFEARPGYDAFAFDHFLYKGQAPRWVDLDGRWAVPGTTYGQTILSIYNNMRTYVGLAPVASSGLSASSLLTTAALQATTTLRH